MTDVFLTRRAFTLIEMSVVLVVIALLVGGIVGGQNLKRTSEIRAMTVNVQTYAAAIENFKDHYGSLPGDMPNATRIWGRADGGADDTANCANADTTPSTGKATCNGNGNGQIEDKPLVATLTVTEVFRMWQQLAAAGMIAGHYCGISTSTSDCTASGEVNTVAEVNVPASGLPNSAIFLRSWGYQDPTTANATAFYDGDYTNTITVGSTPQSAGTRQWPWMSVLSAEEAQRVDAKLDDGFPATGFIRTFKPLWYTTNGETACTSSAASNAVYSTNTAGMNCMLLFLNGFAKKRQ